MSDEKAWLPSEKELAEFARTMEKAVRNDRVNLLAEHANLLDEHIDKLMTLEIQANNGDQLSAEKLIDYWARIGLANPTDGIPYAYYTTALGVALSLINSVTGYNGFAAIHADLVGA